MCEHFGRPVSPIYYRIMILWPVVSHRISVVEELLKCSQHLDHSWYRFLQRTEGDRRFESIHPSEEGC
jgi:hypothetical protein